jgi:hypothetical protein
MSGAGEGSAEAMGAEKKAAEAGKGDRMNRIYRIAP